MRRLATRWVFLFGLAVLLGLPVHAQNRSACELLSKADAEAVLRVTLQPPKPTAPFRSLLDPDFTKGTPEQGCEFTNFVPNQPKPSKVVTVDIEVRYSSTPDARAVDETRRQVDTRTYDHPTDLPGLGDAAFWIGQPNDVTLFVFLGGTKRLMIGPSEIGLAQEKALAVKAISALGKGAFAYGAQPTGLTKPVLSKLGPDASGLDQLKHALTAKADAGDAKAQFALGRLYQSGAVAPDGNAQRDYAGAAYWYRQASDRGETQAMYELALLYHDGRGVPADASQSFQLLRRAAEAGYVPATPPLSELYAEQKTPVSGERATDWATKAADAGDPRGWLILGFEYDTGKLGGDPPYWHQKAMEEFRKAADKGNCIAMMAIGDLYGDGNGVRADQTQARSWHAKSQSCRGANLATLQQQVAQFRARAAAGRDPALSGMFSAFPEDRRSAARDRNPRHGSASDRPLSFDDLVTIAAATVAIAFAIDVLDPTPASGGVDVDIGLQMENHAGCMALGGHDVGNPGGGWTGVTCD